VWGTQTRPTSAISPICSEIAFAHPTRDRLAEQPAELLDRHLLNVMLRKISLDQLLECEAAWDPPLPPNTIELALQRSSRVRLGDEPTTLHASGITACEAIPKRPAGRAVPTRRLEFEHLSLLPHSYPPMASTTCTVVELIGSSIPFAARTTSENLLSVRLTLRNVTRDVTALRQHSREWAEQIGAAETLEDERLRFEQEQARAQRT
jgi:hypothetical protein